MMSQLLCHLWGDYILQSHWMAQNKRRDTTAAWVHATLYTLCFLPLCNGSHWILQGQIIYWSHFFIDRFGLARYVVFAKNFLGWPWPKWEDCRATGYPSECPAWLAVWLMIVADNTLHLSINYLALKYL
jgi:hypothetical protein